MPENKSPITPDLCHRERLVFYPKDADEAIFIQQKLIDMGCRWTKSGAKIANVTESVLKGLLCEKGVIYHSPDTDKPYLLCAIDQFNADYVSPDQAFLLDRFNELSARIDDLAGKVDRIHDALFPDVDKTKPTLKKPRGTTYP